MPSQAQQNWWLAISRTAAGAWSVDVSRLQPHGLGEIRYRVDEIETTVTETVTDATASVADLIWRHELAAYAYQQRSHAIGIARQVVRAASEARIQTSFAVSLASKAEAVAVAFAVRALLGRSAPVRGYRVQIFRQKLVWALAAITAWPALLISVLRFGGSSPASLQPASTIHAVHGEWETRTRHLLPPRYDPGPRPQYLIIGRPRQRLKAIAATLVHHTDMQSAVFVRALDLRAAVHAIFPGFRKIASGFHDAAASPIQTGWRDSLAVAFRMTQGAAHRHWWKRRRHAPSTVVFGHTGNADTSQLECEMQSGGTRTIHVVHGVNHGWPFAGISDLGVFQSKHDAELARSIGSYGRTDFIASPCPAFEPGGRGWLILTSYTHPMGRLYATDGVQPDIKALELVAAAARSAAIEPASVVWRPHPAIEKVAQSNREYLEAAAARHGFTRWPDGQPLAAMKSFKTIVTTPSTVLLDALHLGKCPILVVTAPLQNDLIYAAYPLRAHTAEELVHRADAARAPDALTLLWSNLGPSQPMTTDDPIKFTSAAV